MPQCETCQAYLKFRFDQAELRQAAPRDAGGTVLLAAEATLSISAVGIAVVGASTQAKARVAVFKGALILGAAIAVGVQIVWRLANPAVPLFEAMGAAALLNLGANTFCLYLLTPYRHGDVNMASAWECSRNDVWEGFAVLAAAGGVWMFGAGWPDLVVAGLLLVMFLRSAIRVFQAAWRGLRPAT